MCSEEVEYFGEGFRNGGCLQCLLSKFGEWLLGEDVEYSPVRLQMPVSILTCAVIEAMVDVPVRSTLLVPPLLTHILIPHLC